MLPRQKGSQIYSAKVSPLFVFRCSEVGDRCRSFLHKREFAQVAGLWAPSAGVKSLHGAIRSRRVFA
jgi:hypothetical protein